MKVRCYNPHTKAFKYYGRKNPPIVVCDEWLDFVVFRDWALTHSYSDDLVIHRKDSEQGYNPENCEFITALENTEKSHKKKWS